jgi:hypothetical protein
VQAARKYRQVTCPANLPYPLHVHLTRTCAAYCLSGVLLTALGFRFFGASRRLQPTPQNAAAQTAPRAYLGFDRNDYPGDAALPALRKTFSFAGYWLSNPPGENSNSWRGRRAALAAQDFGFLLLSNGRLYRALKASGNPQSLGKRDAAAAVAAARREGFPEGATIFLDQEQGGRLLPEQRAYVHAWVDAIHAANFGAGIYCSGMPAMEDHGTLVTTAEDVLKNSAGRKIVFFVYNDACPPSPGCASSQNPPSPEKSGVPFAAVWQFAQSPRRKDVTASCPPNYDADGSCYAQPHETGFSLYLDLDSATSADPSNARR